MNIYSVAFIGHRRVERYDEVERRLKEVITELIKAKEFVEFQIGRNGELDILAAPCIKQVQSSHGKENSAITLVLPYRAADEKYFEEFYDSIIIPPETQSAHFKSAITKRNEWLAKNSDLLIAYVRRAEGGAAACVKMAQKAKIDILKL